MSALSTTRRQVILGENHRIAIGEVSIELPARPALRPTVSSSYHAA